MTNFLSILAEADEASLRLERARRELESAKQNLESAKAAYDAVVAKADELGLPKAKLKRLTEERLAALIETGLANLPSSQAAATKPAPLTSERPKKSSKAKASSAETEARDNALNQDETGENEITEASH